MALTLIPKISQISPRIIRILGCNPGPMTLQGTNTYLIGTGERRVLLDTGENDNKEYISSLVNVLKKQETNVGSIIISHWHHDHVGGLGDVLSSTGKGNQVVHKYPRSNPPDDPFPNGVNIKNLQDKDKIEVEGATLRVHHTPGHTTDHIVLELEEENAIFSGDCILGEGTAVFEDLHTYMASLKVILELTPKVMYPGHGPVIEDPIDRIKQYIDHRNLRERQIIQALRDSESMFLSAMDLVKIIYTTTPEHLHGAAALNVGHHLQKLYKDKLLHQRYDTFCLKERLSKV